ncbi:MAG: glycosyltransferase family 4 protein [Phycisphaerae bacterium]
MRQSGDDRPVPLIHESSLQSIHASAIHTPHRTITICHPVWQLGVGGLEGQLVRLVNGLPRDVYRHLVVARGWDEQSERMDAELGDHVELIKQIGPSRERTWSRRLAGILREHAVDILHVRGLSMLVDAVLAADAYGDTSVAFSFHGFESSDARIRGVRRKVYREALLRCRARWAVSPSATRAIQHELNLPEQTVETITNGVDTRRFVPTGDRRTVRRQLGLPEDGMVVLSVGNLKPIKGHEHLLESVSRMGPITGGATLVLVGEDYLDGCLQRTADEMPGGWDIRFVGRQDDVLPWYQAADLFVLPSLWEGMSNALLEAMGCGLPVIATRVGGNSDVIRDGETGVLVDVGDVSALSEAIRRMIENVPLRSELGQAARDHVIRKFSLERTILAYGEAYRQLVASAEIEAARAEARGSSKLQNHAG